MLLLRQEWMHTTTITTTAAAEEREQKKWKKENECEYETTGETTEIYEMGCFYIFMMLFLEQTYRTKCGWRYSSKDK